MINEERILDSFLQYVQIDSESGQEKAFQDHLISELEEMGYDYYVDEAGKDLGLETGNLIVTLPGQSDTTLLLSAHMDTVSPGQAIRPVIRDGVIYSEGPTILGADDKAGIAAIMETLRVIKEEGLDHHNLEIAFTIGEEVGMDGSKNLDYSKVKADYGIVLDSEGKPGQVIVQAPAQNTMEITFRGQAAHAGIAPEEGVSAIQLAAQAISKMDLLRIDEETTANIGYISGGGPTNIVTDQVTIRAEARSLDNDKLQAQTDHMLACVKEAQEGTGFEADIRVEEPYKAFKIDEDAEILAMVREACQSLGLDFVTRSTGGGSDANNFNLKGIPTVNLAVGMTNPHSLDEHIAIQDLIDAGSLVLEIVTI